MICDFKTLQYNLRGRERERKREINGFIKYNN